MAGPSDFRLTKMPLNNGGHISALGFGILIPDAAVTRSATRDALEAQVSFHELTQREN